MPAQRRTAKQPRTSAKRAKRKASPEPEGELHPKHQTGNLVLLSSDKIKFRTDDNGFYRTCPDLCNLGSPVIFGASWVTGEVLVCFLAYLHCRAHELSPLPDVSVLRRVLLLTEIFETPGTNYLMLLDIFANARAGGDIPHSFVRWCAIRYDHEEVLAELAETLGQEESAASEDDSDSSDGYRSTFTELPRLNARWQNAVLT